MDSNYDRDRRQLRLDFASAKEVESFVDTARRELGFLVTLPVGLKLHDVIRVDLALDTHFTTVEARVAQVFDNGFGRFRTALLVDRWPEISALEASGLSDETGPVESLHDDPAGPLGSKPENGVEVPNVESPSLEHRTDEAPLDDESAEEPEPLGHEGEMRGTSPIHTIKKMNPRQRAMLAMRASRTQRKILLRDNSPQVLQNLLVNPQIDSEEVLQIARSSHVNAPILQRIANDARWNGNQEILAIIARHPKTPSLFATRLMPTLRTSDLRTMAKMSSGLREMTRKAALREYMRRTGQRI